MGKNENFDAFKARLIGKMSEEDVHRVMFAYQISKEAHRRQFRDGGKVRYFEHARAGCLVLMDELGIYDPMLLIAFLFHDVGEDTPLLGSIIKDYERWIVDATFRVNLLYPGAADLVIGLTKPFVDNVWFHTKDEAFAYYVSHLNGGKLILLKAVDRLINLRDMDNVKPTKIRKQVIETREVYLPIFNKLHDFEDVNEYGMYLIKRITDRLAELDEILLAA